MHEKTEKGITSMMDEQRKFPPPKSFQEKAKIRSLEDYEKLYKESIEDPEGFWGRLAEDLHWFKKWDRVYYWNPEGAECRWFEGGKLNVSYNCLDRHLNTPRAKKVAIQWEGEPLGEDKAYTYEQLHREVCRFANVLKKKGIKKGDRVCIYLPMIPELPIAMLACARIGAIHSVVFGGFSADSLRDRIQDSGAKMVITVDAGYRNGRIIELKRNVDEALAKCPSVEKVIVVNRAYKEVAMAPGKESWWHEEMNAADIKDECPPEQMDAEDPLFILYTSGSTGKPKGVLHTTAGYLVYTAQTFRYIFDYRDEDIFWCTADIGWITGHSYIVYGPLCEGATSVMYEGVPFYPEKDRFWQIVEKYKVSIFYTAPTAIRAIMREGDEWPNRCDLSSLRLLGTVGEPINPEAWMWYHRVIGKGECPIVDTWWQTETGGVLITPLPGAFILKPGSATKPFFGVAPMVIREDGSEARPNEGGYLIITKPWPGMMRGVYGDPKRFKEVYFTLYPGLYFTGDGARKDEDGDYWLMGRIDDVINVSGHRLGTAEIESALVSHPAVSEAAVVPMPHEIKGQGIYAFVILKAGVESSESMRKQLVAHVRKEIGPIATPDELQFAEGLPKTRSGKIMRRILRKIAEGSEQLGDTTTLADTTVVDSLLKGKKESGTPAARK
ncbi:MAG: acetate--CoA ligase [Candidatus Abyssubacteria bacterium]